MVLNIQHRTPNSEHRTSNIEFLKILLLVFFTAFTRITAQDIPVFSVNEFNERVCSFRFEPGIKISINAPAAEKFMKDRPAGIILYALPNGNSTEWTIGKKPGPGDDWHYGIQNIGAQTRFLREKIKDFNVITVYLETDEKSWPAWNASHSGHDSIVNALTAKIMSLFKNDDPFLVLSGHSGGGRFIFTFLDANEKIPDYVKRICFLDSDYGYESFYEPKLSEWLKSSTDDYICVLAYNDSNVVLNRKKIVSPEGGTWYRSRMMLKDLSEEFRFSTEEKGDLIFSKALGGRIQIILHKNPLNEILHTVQVEKNGFIHSVLSGTVYENDGYEYFGETEVR